MIKHVFVAKDMIRTCAWEFGDVLTRDRGYDFTVRFRHESSYLIILNIIGEWANMQ